LIVKRQLYYLIALKENEQKNASVQLAVLRNGGSNPADNAVQVSVTAP
jgi:hypothetical protein